MRDGTLQRLRWVAGKHGQAEIARRTGTSRQNVSRYLAGTRAPLEFGTALVRGLGLNPAWLLAGEGSPYLADVATDTQATAAGLMELISAMNAIMKMRLGELTGLPNRKVLRELSDNLVAYRRLRGKLDEQTQPFLRRLIDDMRAATRKGDFRAARELRTAAEQAASFCDEASLTEDLEAACAILEHETGNTEAALKIGRRVLLRCFPDGPTHQHFGVESHNYILSLYDTGHLQEARRMCNAVLALMEQAPERRDIEIVAALLDMECGDIRGALSRLHATVLVLERQMPAATSALIRAELLTGLNPVRSVVCVGPENRSKSYALLTFAAWAEDAADLALVRDMCVGIDGPGGVETGSRNARRTILLLSLLTGKRAHARRALANHMEQFGPQHEKQPLGRLTETIYACQYHRLCGDTDAAAGLLRDANGLILALPPDLTPRLLQLAVHHRNAAALGEPELAGSAKQFFARHFAAGYGCFRAMVEAT